MPLQGANPTPSFGGFGLRLNVTAEHAENAELKPISSGILRGLCGYVRCSYPDIMAVGLKVVKHRQ